MDPTRFSTRLPISSSSITYVFFEGIKFYVAQHLLTTMATQGIVTENYDILKTPPKALTFDVFGTVVNWRKTVTESLIFGAAAKTSSSSRSAGLPPVVRIRLAELTAEGPEKAWGEFAQEWRNSYKVFVRNYNPETDPWMDIDAHHHRSLVILLKQWGLVGLYDENEIEDLSRVWHSLDPWDDTSAGVHLLGKKFITSTLSNGNQSLLNDLNVHGDIGFTMIQSSEDFRAYKPHSSVYLGAAKKMDLQPEEVCMVAAHLSDLKAAKDLGFRAIFVERPREEDWKVDSKEYQDAKTWVDMWVSEKEDGFLEVARRFGIK
jgi:2-haloacid dehalogenase